MCGVFLLTGCTDADYDKGLSYFGLDEVRLAPQESPSHYAAEYNSIRQSSNDLLSPQKIVADANPFCESVAMQDANENAFDQATKQRFFTSIYRQCVIMFGRISP